MVNRTGSFESPDYVAERESREPRREATFPRKTGRTNLLNLPGNEVQPIGYMQHGIGCYGLKRGAIMNPGTGFRGEGWGRGEPDLMADAVVQVGAVYFPIASRTLIRAVATRPASSIAWSS